MDFHTLKRRELQALCKKNGIRANITNVAMADALCALHSTVQGIEEPSDCTRRSTRLAVKTAEFFSADRGDNFEMNAKECCVDPSEDVTGDDIHERLEVENKDEVIGENGNDINEKPEVENKDEVMGEYGDDLNEGAEVEIKDEVFGDDDDDITKQPDTEINIKVVAETENFNGEGDKLNGSGEVVTGDKVFEVQINAVNDNDDGKLVSEVMKDMCLTSNDDMITQTEDHGDAIIVDKFAPMSEEEKDLVKVTAVEHVDNSGCDITSRDISKEDECSPKLEDENEEEKEERDLVKVAAGEEVEIIEREDEFLRKSEEDLEKVAAGQQLVNRAIDKPNQENSKEHEFLLNSESSEEDEEEEDLINVAVGEQLVNGNSDKPSQENSKDDEVLPKSFLFESEGEEDLVKVAAEVNKASDLNSEEVASNKASIFVDNEDSILLPAITAPLTPEEKKYETRQLEKILKELRRIHVSCRAWLRRVKDSWM